MSDGVLRRRPANHRDQVTIAHRPGLNNRGMYHGLDRPAAVIMSAVAIGQRQVRRSGHGAMQPARPAVLGPPPDPASAIGILRATIDPIRTAHYATKTSVNAGV